MLGRLTAHGITWAMTSVGCFLAVLLAAPDPLTLEEAVRQAIQQQPLLEGARQEHEAALARQRQARSVLYPQVNLLGQALGATSNSTAISSITLPDLPRVGSHSNPRAPYSPGFSSWVGVGAHMRLVDFGATRGEMDAADATAEAVQASRGQLLQDVILRVSTAYYQSAAAEESLQVAVDARLRAQAHHDLAEAGFKSGMKPQIDLARADAELAAVQLQVIRAQNNVAITRSGLDLAIGWEPHPYTLQPPPLDEPTKPAENSRPGQDDEQVAIVRALLVRPELLSLQLHARAAEARTRSAHAGYYPVLTATASATWQGYQRAPDTFNWDVGLVLQVPVFNGFLTASAEDEAAAILGQVEARQRSVRDGVLYQVREARSTLASAREAVQASLKQVEGASANLRQAEGRYREGLGNIVELTDAQSQNDAAKQGLVESRLAVALSNVQLLHAYADLQGPP